MPNVSVVPSALSIPRDAPLRNPTRCHVRSGFLDSTEVELQEDTILESISMLKLNLLTNYDVST